MGDSNNWPLPIRVEEKIEAEQVKIHDKYWPELSAMDSSQHDMSIASLATFGKAAPLPRQPIKLGRILREYSVALFQASATRYPKGPLLEERLRNLGTWVIEVVMERLTKHLPNLRYHLHEDLMRREMVESVVEKIDSFNPKVQLTGRSVNGKKHRSLKQPAAGIPNSRINIKEAYFAKFPQTMIIDVCWAAKQHRREWDKWIKGQVKDGSKPDRSFRWVMTSDKEPKELRPELRPKTFK